MFPELTINVIICHTLLFTLLLMLFQYMEVLPCSGWLLPVIVHEWTDWNLVTDCQMLYLTFLMISGDLVLPFLQCLQRNRPALVWQRGYRCKHCRNSGWKCFFSWSLEWSRLMHVKYDVGKEQVISRLAMTKCIILHDTDLNKSVTKILSHFTESCKLLLRSPVFRNL